MNKMLALALCGILTLGCAEKNKNVYINNVVADEAPSQIFLPPEGSIVNITILASTGEEELYTGTIISIGAGFFIIEAESPYGPFNIQIFFTSIVDFELLSLPVGDDDMGGDDGSGDGCSMGSGDDSDGHGDNNNTGNSPGDQDCNNDMDDSDDDDDDDLKCGHKKNKVHVKWFKKCKKNHKKKCKDLPVGDCYCLSYKCKITFICDK